MIAYKTVLMTGLVSLLSTGFALAQDGATWDDDDDDNNSPWSIELELGVEQEPAYTGSDVYVTEPGLEIEVAYNSTAGHEYFVSLGELGVRWALGDDRLLSTLLEYEPGRENENDNALNGFPVVQDTVELQVEYQQNIGPVIAGAWLQYDIRNRGKGTVGFLGVAYERQINERLGMQLQSDLSFADAEHMQIEVGISAETAQITGYEQYAPDSGYKGLTVSLGLNYALTQQFSLLTEVSVEHYGEIMAKSPLIKDEGTAINHETFLGVQYEF